MYALLLFLHSLFRWLVLGGLIFIIGRFWPRRKGNHPFLNPDKNTAVVVLVVCSIQALLGLTLYIISPIISYFWQNYITAVHIRQIRFFGMEHSLMMLLALLTAIIGILQGLKRKEDGKKFKTIAICCGIALLVILLNIPWPFSPLTSRPWFRPL